MNTEERNSRRIIAEAKEGETSALFIVVAIMAALLLAVAMWVLPRPADAAKRNVYTGTVTICYAPSAKSDPYAQYLQSLWVAQLPAAVKAAQPAIGKVRIVKERYPLTSCYGEVRIASTSQAWANNATRPYDVYRYGEAGVMWESQITMGDKVGAKSTAAQRQAWLVAALKTAIPR
jgi:hypothetical protein